MKDGSSSWLSWAEIDVGALRGNARWFRRRIGARRRLFVVVKADAYGHGVGLAAPAALAGGADSLAVAHAEEGAEVRNVCPAERPILVFAPALASQAELLRGQRLTATLCSLEGARSLHAAAGRLGARLPVQVNVDTGMGRLGPWHEEASALIEGTARMPCLELTGVYSHLACADEDAEFTREQLQRFARLRAECAVRVPCWHIANSAGAILDRRALFDGVRSGIAFYGADPGPDCALPEGLRPALHWRARITFVKSVRRGRTIGYGAAFTAPRAMRIATLAAGYADGYPRAAAGRAFVLLRGVRCRVLGRVTMDQIMIDVTRLPGVRPGAVATLVGEDNGSSIRAGELASWAGTISYEILTGISRRVRRVAVGREPTSRETVQ